MVRVIGFSQLQGLDETILVQNCSFDNARSLQKKPLHNAISTRKAWAGAYVPW